MTELVAKGENEVDENGDRDKKPVGAEDMKTGCWMECRAREIEEWKRDRRKREIEEERWGGRGKKRSKETEGNAIEKRLFVRIYGEKETYRIKRSLPHYKVREGQKRLRACERMRWRDREREKERRCYVARGEKYERGKDRKTKKRRAAG